MPGRLLTIGDIHGHSRALDAVLAAVAPTEEDRLIFLGDYVHRGPDTCGVLDRMVSLSEQSDHVFLRGNHDSVLLDTWKGEIAPVGWRSVAGENRLSGYDNSRTDDPFAPVPTAHWNFLESTCQNYYETDDHIFVHGGIPSEDSPSDAPEDDLLWLRLDDAEPHHSKKTVICGHTSQNSGHIADLGHTICIDTAIWKGGWLTCLCIESSDYWQSDQNGTIRTGRLR